MSIVDNPEIRKESFFEHPKFNYYTIKWLLKDMFCQRCDTMLNQLKEFLATGIESQRIAENALLVYLHLIEVQNWFDVESVVVDKEQCVLIKGKRTEMAKSFEYVLPVHSDVSFSPIELDNLIDIACENGCEEKSLLLAFVDNSSSIIYYKITRGLIPPSKPSQKELLKMNKIPEWNEQKGKWKIQ